MASTWFCRVANWLSSSCGCEPPAASLCGTQSVFEARSGRSSYRDFGRTVQLPWTDINSDLDHAVVGGVSPGLWEARFAARPTAPSLRMSLNRPRDALGNSEFCNSHRGIEVGMVFLPKLFRCRDATPRGYGQHQHGGPTCCAARQPGHVPGEP